MKKILLILASFSLLFLTSCIKMDSNLVIDNNLQLNGETTFDYTQLNAMNGGFTASFSNTGSSVTQQEITKTLPCDNLKSGSGGLSMGIFKNPTCVNIDDNIAKVIGKGGDLSKYIMDINGDYKLDLKGISESNSKDDGKTEEEKIQSINMLKSMGFEMNYKITFPSGIIKHNVGTIDGNTLSFSVFDLINEENPYVIFKNNGKIHFKIDNNILNNIELSSKSSLFKKLILSKRELEKTYKGRKDIAKFESLIPKVDDKKLVDLNNRISNIDKSNRIYKKYEDFFNYLDAKIGLEIYKRGLNK